MGNSRTLPGWNFSGEASPFFNKGSLLPYSLDFLGILGEERKTTRTDTHEWKKPN